MIVADFLVNETFLWVVIGLSGLVSVICQFVARKEWYESNHCENFDEIEAVAWADLLFFVCFVHYAHLCCVIGGGNPIARRRALFLVLIVDTFQCIAKLWGASLCGTIPSLVNFWDYFCIVLVWIAYCGNTIVVYLGRHVNYTDAHLSFFIIMAVLLFIDLLVEIPYHGTGNAFSAFNYFNAKVGIVVFEIFVDEHWDKICFDNFWGSLLFFFFMVAKIGRQVYYYAVYNGGWSANIEIAFMVFAVIDMACCGIMIYFRW
jgi:hypothetical protein